MFWTEAPAKLVGWFNRVWNHGFAYRAKENGQGGNVGDGDGVGINNNVSGVAPMKTLAKALVIAIAGNTEETLREQGRLQSMENVMLGDRLYDRAHHKEFVCLGGTERSNPERRETMRAQHLETAYQRGLLL